MPLWDTKKHENWEKYFQGKPFEKGCSPTNPLFIDKKFLGVESLFSKIDSTSF